MNAFKSVLPVLIALFISLPVSALVDPTEITTSEEAEKAIDNLQGIPVSSKSINLEAIFTMVHGDEVIATTEGDTTFVEVAETYAKWISRLIAK